MSSDPAPAPLVVTRLATGASYDAPHHFGVQSVRLAGREFGGADRFWLGLSRIAPGGGAGPDASPLEKVYFVLSGELVVTVAGTETVLRAQECCTIARNVERAIINRTDQEVEMLVVMPYPAAAGAAP